jgi:acetylornithine deacetylase/succinyl-diaminopimelate desuccinylase-like protein
MPVWEAYLRANRERFLNELLAFLRIPSISALPRHAADVREAAGWVANRLQAAGLESVSVMETGGHPVVYGEWLRAPGRPTVMIYGHFDVEPAQHAARWTSPPFEPQVRSGRIYGRGASDDKGNLLIPILAVEALLKTEGTLPVNIKFFCEGQEEIGSPELPAFLARHRERFACDAVLSTDSGQYSETDPALTIACRGLCAIEVVVRGPRSDLHSGVYGGAVPNPLHGLVRMLVSLHREDGSVAVPGFYDGIDQGWMDLRHLCRTVPFDDQVWLDQLGVERLVGESGYSALERTWFRPTIEINGVQGGFAGQGVQTVLPGEARAKLSCRLAAGQEPQRVLDLVAAHLKRHTPPGVRASVEYLPGRARAYHMAPDHPVNRAAHEVLTGLYGRTPHYVGMGGTIPVCALFEEHLGVQTVQFGFGLDDENIHGPDEFLRLASWERGQIAYGLLIDKLGQWSQDQFPIFVSKA